MHMWQVIIGWRLWVPGRGGLACLGGVPGRGIRAGGCACWGACSERGVCVPGGGACVPRYTSYWNAFLLVLKLSIFETARMFLGKPSHSLTPPTETALAENVF